MLRLTAYLLGLWGFAGVLAYGLFPGSEVLLIAIAVYTTLPIIVFLRWRGFPFYPSAMFRRLVVGALVYTQFALLITTILGAAGVLIGTLFAAPLRGGHIGGAIALGAFTLLALAGYLGARQLNIQHLDAPIPGLPSEFAGFRIAQITDLHVGPQTSKRFLRRVVQAIENAQPDLIAITGDLVDDRAEDTALFLRAFQSLAAPSGVFIVPGNHDVYARWDHVRATLDAAGFGTILVNESHLLHRGNERLAIIGTGDPAFGRVGSGAPLAPDLAAALADVPDRVPVVALVHNPSLWPKLVERKVALTLSGHTHWGQFAIRPLRWCLATPFLGVAMGAYIQGPSMLYISPGTGYWGIPFRIGAAPEVTVVTLAVA